MESRKKLKNPRNIRFGGCVIFIWCRNWRLLRMAQMEILCASAVMVIAVRETFTRYDCYARKIYLT